MSKLGEDFNELRITVWHSINYVDGRKRLIPYRDLFKIRELIVHLWAVRTTFSQPVTMLSKLSITQILLRSEIVKCQDSLDRTNRVIIVIITTLSLFRVGLTSSFKLTNVNH